VTLSGPTDAELVDAARRGSREAAGTLVTRHLRACRAVALAVTNDVDAADDICQDAMVRAIEMLDGCRDPDRFGAWVRQITRNLARNDRRRAGFLQLEPVRHESAASREPTPDQVAERSELRRGLLRALGMLSEERREVVLLHDLEGWTHREIAERMDLPDGTVRSHLHHARRRLRELLQDFIEGEPNGE